MAAGKGYLKELSDSMADAVEEAGLSTVTVDGRERFPSSGVAISPKLILSANHSIRKNAVRIRLAEGGEGKAELVGRDMQSDLALVRLNGGNAKAGSPAKEEAQVGQIALALGRPTVEGVQASLGIVSAVGGPSYAHHGGLIEAHIRTDANAFPGFSGGPLINADGEILGINTSGRGRGHSVTIPIDRALAIADSLEAHGSVKRGFLGIRGQVVELSEKSQEALGRRQGSALLLAGIEADSPAAASALIVGDVLVGFNGTAVNTHEDLLALLSLDVVGKSIPTEVLRGGKPQSVEVEVGERESKGDSEKHMYRGRRRRHGWGPWSWRFRR